MWLKRRKKALFRMRCRGKAAIPFKQRRRFAAEVWVKPTEALGGAEEAHRRWPGGRSEQGASKAKVDPAPISRTRAATRH